MDIHEIPRDIRMLLISCDYKESFKEVDDSLIGICVAQESDCGEIELYPQLVFTSQNELWEVTEAASYGGGGSLCGNGQDPKWLFDWRVVNKFPGGTFEQLLALPQAIEIERQKRLKSGRSVKRFNHRVKEIAMDYVDLDYDTFEVVSNCGWSAVLEKL